MMIRSIGFAAALTLTAFQAQAHSEGHGSIEPEDAMRMASSAVAYFTTHDVGKEWGMLPASWGTISTTQTEVLAQVDGYFVVSVHNGEEQQTLYVLVAPDGGVVDANFTGTFPYVWDLQADGAAQASD